MFNFLNLMPLPYRILALILAFSVYSIVVYEKGYSSAENKAKIEQLNAINKAIDDAQKQSKKDLEEATKYLAKQSDIESMFKDVNGKLDKSIKNKAVYNNKDCVIDNEDVSILNNARKGIK